MGKFFTEIPSYLVPWIEKQKMFWVATAPLSASGHVNLSPKGYEGTFHIVNEKRVWYEDLTGSGIETIAHLKENGRMTIMFAAFEGPARTVRLFGTGTVHEFGSAEYEALLPVEKRCVGSRAAIVLDIDKVGSSCGYSVPLYDFKVHRTALNHLSVKLESKDIQAETDSCSISASPSSNTSAVGTTLATETDTSSQVPTYPLTDKGLKGYWKDNNCKSIDGLPGVSDGFKALQLFSPNAKKPWIKDRPHVEHVEPASSVQAKKEVRGVLSTLAPSWEQEKHGIVVGFVLGLLVMVVAQRGMSALAGIQWS